MLRGFKDFIMRGNVVDLAVGIVIAPPSPAWLPPLPRPFVKP